MTVMEELKLIEQLRKGCQFLENEGYQYHCIEGQVKYVKNIENEGLAIEFRIFEWSKRNYRIDAFTALKRFNEVEKPIQNVIGGELENYYTIYTKPSLNDIPNEVEHTIFNESVEFIVKTDTDVDLIIEFIKNFYKNTALPFFERNDLLNTYNFYKDLQREDISTFLLNTGNDIFYRELSLKKLFNQNGVFDYYDMIMKDLNQLRGNSTFDKIAENLTKLLSTISST